MRCDIIALGIIKAVQEVGMKKPIVVRLQGTNVAAAKEILENSGLRIVMAEDLDDAAQKAIELSPSFQLLFLITSFQAVRMSEIVKLAQDVGVKVSFDLPL